MRGRTQPVGLRTWLVIGTAVVVLGAGAGVGLALATHHTAAPSSALSVPTSAPTTVAPAPPTCPLTGTPAPDGVVPQRPALAVKVDNYPAARPQSGLDKADVVFEEPVEGMITRLVAVFHCQSATQVGPIRSARAVDVQILDQLSDPLFVHAGGIQPVLDLLAQGHLTDENVFTHGSIVQLNPNRVAPYSTYISTTGGWGLQPSNTTPPVPIFTYGANPPAGTPASSVNIPFSSTNNVTWTWEAAAERWGLSYSGSPATVAGGGQITTTNVVVETVHVTFGPWLENDQGGYEVQAQLTGSGPLEVFRNGQKIAGTWQRPSLTSQTSLLAADGTVIPLAPGPTWVEIVPTTVTVTSS